MIDNDFRHGQTVKFQCPRNYVMNGAQTMTCSNGHWSNVKPSCQVADIGLFVLDFVAPCGDLAPPVHGWKSGDDFSHGQTVSFYCRFGYTRVGASPITCNDGKWDRPVPICKARCMFLGRPVHGFYMKGMRTRGDMITHGVQITYDCLATYTMVGANMQECDNGRWTNGRPQCKASCGSPGSIARGKKTGSNYGHGKTVRYDCDAEYTLEGKNILTCNDGKWNYNPPNCRAPCRDPGPPINGKIHGGDFRHNSWVTFSCDRNYQLDGNERIKCNDGTWSGSAPKCIAVCADPGKPANGKRLDDNFQDGNTVTFKCNVNHDLVGNRTIRCNGRVWSSDAPKCKGNNE
ncbi:hypothetical protein OS493_027681 [Desmophyllum pertusum]|uniref:Sushi domain-containing protein n=1 Tax=Desmophyllum pertusum TaxID=174260 RepID=A0A9W9ZLH6_9CNID|nr:hypothetical protein OS493_027681 [Desmophyllum pertusum]